MVARLRRFGPGLLVMLLVAGCGAPESDPSGLTASSDSAVPATDPIPSNAAATIVARTRSRPLTYSNLAAAATPLPNSHIPLPI